MLFTFRGLNWAETKTRKSSCCWHCNHDIVVGQQAYKPITNSQSRWRRLCCVPEDATILTAAPMAEPTRRKPVSDLIKQLRAGCIQLIPKDYGTIYYDECKTDDLLNKAADEIERLRSILRSFDIVPAKASDEETETK